MEEGGLIRDFAILIGTAGIAGLVFHFLRLPLLLGYILSGLIIGPHSFLSDYIQNYDVLKQFGDLGVIFLMFYIGLEFNLDKLKRTVGPSLLAVIFEAIWMMFVGILSARCLGWSGLNGLFLGALMSISSTMMTIPVLREKKVQDTNFGQLSVGILVLEDFVAILLLVVLSGISVTGHFKLSDISKVSLLVGVFVVFVFVTGRFFGARISSWLQKMDSPELLVIVPVGIALGLGELADVLHLSSELGAFLAGSILSQSVLAHKIEQVTESLRNIFCAIFFVTIGMLIDPSAIGEHGIAIVLISIAAITVQITVCWFGLYLSGVEAKTAFYAAVYKAQIGEFSFVIAGLGTALGVTNPALMTLAVGLSICTIVISTLIRKYIEPLYATLSTHMPKSLVNLGKLYRNFQQLSKLELEKMTLLKVAKPHLLGLILYFLMLVGLMGFSGYISHLVQSKSLLVIEGHETLSLVVIWVAATFIIMPIFVGVVKNLNAIINLILDQLFESVDGADQQKESRSIQTMRHVVLSIVLLFFGIIFVSVSSSYLPTGLPLAAFVLVAAGQAFWGWRDLMKSNSRFEKSFQQTFIAEVQERDDAYQNAMLQKAKEKYPWAAQIKNFKLPKSSVYVGRKISETNVREQTGTTIVAVSRGGYTCYAPSPDASLFPDDQLLLLGEPEQIEAATQFFSQEAPEGVRLANRMEFAIDYYGITPMSPFLGKSIATTGIRSRYGVNIAGIQRNGKKITTPKPTLVLEKDDILILTGSKKAIEQLKQSELTSVL